MKKLIRALIVPAFLLVLPGIASAATIVAFSGSGTSGTDPFGHPWLVNTTEDGDGAWGIPGLGEGTLQYSGSETAYDFHITFFDSQGAIAIDALTPNPGGASGFNESTRFVAGSTLWDRFVLGNSVSFLAPGADGLAVGESFFVNVTFLRPISGDLTFDASWTNAAEAPEPASLLLLGMGVLAAGTRRWRQSKA